MEVINHGQIERMSIPDGWVEGPPATFQGIGTRSLREFHPLEAPEAQLCLFYRGLPVNEQAGQSLVSLLNKPDHELSGEELSSLREILRERSDPEVFELVSVPQVRNLNSRLVLLIEGSYKQADKYLEEILIDADGTGRVVQEIYFIAPADAYCAYAAQAKQSFDSIRWKAPVQV